MRILTLLYFQALILNDAETSEATPDQAGQTLDLFDMYEDAYDGPTRAERAAELIHKTQGRIFGATVLTRSGTLREFNAKTVTDSFENTDETNLVVVRENNAKGYRSIALEGVKQLRIDGETYDLDAEFGVLSVEEPASDGLSFYSKGDIMYAPKEKEQYNLDLIYEIVEVLNDGFVRVRALNDLGSVWKRGEIVGVFPARMFARREIQAGDTVYGTTNGVSYAVDAVNSDGSFNIHTTGDVTISYSSVAARYLTLNGLS